MQTKSHTEDKEGVIIQETKRRKSIESKGNNTKNKLRRKF
jgi:hypothetical protein